MDDRDAAGDTGSMGLLYSPIMAELSRDGHCDVDRKEMLIPVDTIDAMMTVTARRSGLYNENVWLLLFSQQPVMDSPERARELRREVDLQDAWDVWDLCGLLKQQGAVGVLNGRIN